MTTQQKEQKKLRYLALAGVFAALITIMTAYLFHIPIGLNGGYIHFGDMLIYLAASILPTPYAAAAAAIGGGLADLLTAPIWMPATIIIKFLLVLPFTQRKGRIICKQNIIACFIAMAISLGGYYIAEVILFGKEAAFLASITGNSIQAIGSMILYLAFAEALDRAHIKSRFGFLSTQE